MLDALRRNRHRRTVCSSDHDVVPDLGDEHDRVGAVGAVAEFDLTSRLRRRVQVDHSEEESSVLLSLLVSEMDIVE